MSRIAFLSTDNLEDFFVYDELLVPVFEQSGHQVDTVSWHSSDTDWSVYSMVIVRSTWDYQAQPEAFLRCLENIDKQAQLQNPLELMRWNLDKSYLKALAEAGIATLPTRWVEHYDEPLLIEQFSAFHTDKMVIKPTVSANADDTFVITPDSVKAQSALLSSCFNHRAHMIQPFADEIVNHGEYSLFYFGGELSHCILKTPKGGDFRVQEEHGGSLELVNADAAQQHISEAVLAALPQPALYARIDIVQFNNQWCVIEVELIEPSLYFNLDDQSPRRFVEAVTELLD